MRVIFILLTLLFISCGKQVTNSSSTTLSEQENDHVTTLEKKKCMQDLLKEEKVSDLADIASYSYGALGQCDVSKQLVKEFVLNIEGVKDAN